MLLCVLVFALGGCFPTCLAGSFWWFGVCGLVVLAFPVGVVA